MGVCFCRTYSCLFSNESSVDVRECTHASTSNYVVTTEVVRVGPKEARSNDTMTSNDKNKKHYCTENISNDNDTDDNDTDDSYNNDTDDCDDNGDNDVDDIGGE
jgi:hypothetical protein